MLDNRTQIISYKHNGVLHRVWQYAYVIRQTSDMIVLVNDHTSVIDGDGRRWKTKEQPCPDRNPRYPCRRQQQPERRTS